MNGTWNAANDIARTHSCVTSGTSVYLSGLRVFISKIQGVSKSCTLDFLRPLQLSALVNLIPSHSCSFAWFSKQFVLSRKTPPVYCSCPVRWCAEAAVQGRALEARAKGGAGGRETHDAGKRE